MANYRAVITPRVAKTNNKGCFDGF